MLGNRTGISTRDRAGEGRVTIAQGVVQGRPQQRPQEAIGVLDAGGRKDLGSLRDQRHEIVRAVRQAEVIAGPVELVDEQGLATHLDDQGEGGGNQIRRRGDPEAAIPQTLQVHLGTGEAHGRMDRHAPDTQRDRRCQRAEPTAPRGMQDQLRRAPGPRGS